VKIQASSVDEFETLSKQFTTVLDLPSSRNAEATVWVLDTPSPPRPGLHAQLILTLKEGAQCSGINEVGFWVENGKKGKAKSKYGNIAWMPII
jgi:hypothetical protein